MKEKGAVIQERLLKKTIPLVSGRMNKQFKNEMNLDDTIFFCTLVLENIVNLSQKLPDDSRFSKFQRHSINSILDLMDIREYITRAVKYIQMDQPMLILSMMLLDKVLEKNKGFVLNESNFHKLFFLCMMETDKFYDDSCLSNKDFALIGGIPSKELLELEIEFMEMIKYQMFIDETNYEQYCLKVSIFWKENQMKKKK